MRLVDLLQAPEELEHVRADDVPELLGELAVVDAKLRRRLMVVEPKKVPKKQSLGRLLTPQEAADSANVEVSSSTSPG